MKFFITTVFLLVMLSSNLAAESNIDKYKKNYAKQLIPLLKERMGTELEMQSEADAHEHVSTLANRMADCQLVAIENYPQKYQDASIIPVANGVDLKKANNDLNLILQTDIQNGDITEQKLKAITEDAIEKYKLCLSDAETNPNY